MTNQTSNRRISSNHIGEWGKHPHSYKIWPYPQLPVHMFAKPPRKFNHRSPSPSWYVVTKVSFPLKLVTTPANNRPSISDISSAFAPLRRRLADNQNTSTGIPSRPHNPRPSRVNATIWLCHLPKSSFWTQPNSLCFQSTRCSPPRSADKPMHRCHEYAPTFHPRPSRVAKTEGASGKANCTTEA